jgi:Uma2 family endonuclease
MSATLKLPEPPPSKMTVKEFLDWSPEDGQRWELVDGTPRAMAPAKRRHGAIQGEVAALLRNHLVERESPCFVVTAGGVVPQVLSANNLRIPDLVVTCTPETENEATVADPVLVVEILSMSNQAETWSNVWTYATMPSVREILVLHTIEIRAQLLRRGADGNWPASPEVVTEGDLALESLGFRAPLRAFYRTTALFAEGRGG